MNWARRSECNVCKHPKFSKVEARTGFGGGYCERGDVEYKEREESDDEFDDVCTCNIHNDNVHVPVDVMCVRSC